MGEEIQIHIQMLSISSFAPIFFSTITGIHTSKKTNSVALVNTISLIRIEKNIYIKEVGVKHQKIHVIGCCIYAF